MAMVCVNGCRECDGCGSCQEEVMELRCPVCGEEIDAESTVYLNAAEEVIGCENCVNCTQAYEVMELLL